MRALIFANGDLKPGPMVERAFAEAGADALVIAADGGARHVLGLEMFPSAVIGDMDSVTPDQLSRCETAGAEILRYPPAKDETDLELALIYAAEQGVTWIRVIGAMGGRLDQTLANVLLMTLPALEGVDVHLVAGRQSAVVLAAGDHDLAGAEGDTLSLIPLGGMAEGVTTTGLEYPLHDETLSFGPARGISNVFAHQVARIRLVSGMLLAVHTLGRA